MSPGARPRLRSFTPGHPRAELTLPPLPSSSWVFHLTNLRTLNDTILETQPKLPANEVSLSGVGTPISA